MEAMFPFSNKRIIRLTNPSGFPLYLRIPAWCASPLIQINGQVVQVESRAGSYAKIKTTWKNDDQITINFPMTLTVKTWKKNKNSVSVNYGPLTYSLKIDEKYTRFDSKETAQYDSKWQANANPSEWPSFEIQPGSAWNYALEGDLRNPEKIFKVVKKPWPADNYPFTIASVPMEIKTKGKRIPGWTVDRYGLCAELPMSPVITNEPEEEITLVPMGAARLRISAFPVVK